MNVWTLTGIIVSAITILIIIGRLYKINQRGGDAENSCKFYGSDKLDGWQCPEEYNTYTGATIGTSSGTFCSGPAQGATCQGFSGVGARVKPTIVDGRITDVKILSGGINYLMAPVIVPDMIIDSDLKFQTEIDGGKLRSVKVLDGGRNLPVNLTLRVEIADPGSGVMAQAKVKEGSIRSVQIIQPGYNYTIAPFISILDKGQSENLRPANLQASVSNGHVTEVRINDGGSGYKGPVDIIFSPGAIRPTCGFCHMCCKGPTKNTAVSAATITKDAQEFHEVIQKKEKKEDIRVQKAEQKWSAIEDQIKQEDKVAQEAAVLGLPPPPPMYSNKELEEAHKSTARKIAPILSEKEKAYCQRLLRRVNEYKKEAAALSKKNNMSSDEVDRSHNLGIKADRLMQIYNRKCHS